MCNFSIIPTEIQSPHIAVRLSADGDSALTDLLWDINDLGLDADQYDQKGLDCICYLKTLYGRWSGGNHDC